ncbi:MAG: hypothetical protein KGZ25_11110 [Planctomycetes bacterium]|nr:hypothetical protein [Planctomycetota bacterium]
MKGNNVYVVLPADFREGKDHSVIAWVKTVEKRGVEIQVKKLNVSTEKVEGQEESYPVVKSSELNPEDEEQKEIIDYTKKDTVKKGFTIVDGPGLFEVTLKTNIARKSVGKSTTQRAFLLTKPVQVNVINIGLGVSKGSSWHGTTSQSSRPWFFSGPAYSQNSKFRYLIEGISQESIDSLRFRILKNNTKKYPVEEKQNEISKTGMLATVGPVGFDNSLPFNGHLTNNQITTDQVNYLDPNNSPFDARLEMQIKNGPTLQQSLSFEVRPRTVIWYNPDRGHPGEQEEYIAWGIGLRETIRYVEGGDLPTMKNATPQEITTDLNKSAAVLIKTDDWGEAYDCLTERGRFFSQAHGGYYQDGTRASFGQIQLGTTIISTDYSYWPGFVPGIFTSSQAVLKVGISYPITSLGLRELHVDLQHCFSDAKSQTGWPWPDVDKNNNGEIDDSEEPLISNGATGDSVADSLRKKSNFGVGSSQVHGYPKAIELWVTARFDGDIVEWEGILADPIFGQFNNWLQGKDESDITMEKLRVSYEYDLQKMRTDLVNDADQWLKAKGVDKNDREGVCESLHVDITKKIMQ